MPEMTKLSPSERSRTYTFPGGDKVVLNDVQEISVSGTTHRLKTGDGKLHIVPLFWIHIEIDADSWTF